MPQPLLALLRSYFLAATFVAGVPLSAAVSDGSPGIDMAGMDQKVAPGDDSNAYANGQWLEHTEIPADRGSWGASRELAEKTDLRLIALIEAAAANREHANPAERLAADYFTAYLDEAGIEARGLSPLQPMLRRIAAITDKTELARIIGGTVRADVDVLNATNLFTENLFGLWVGQGFDDQHHYLPYLMQGGLGMPDRVYYLGASPRMETMRGKYLAHVTNVLRLAGFAEAEARAGRIFELERKLAEAHSTTEETFDVLKANNPWPRAEFAARAPGMNWTAFFDGAGLASPPVFIVWQPRMLTVASALVASEPLEVWQDYLAYHTVNRLSGLLPKAFADERFAFYGTALSGTPQQQARAKRALNSANASIGHAVAQVYVAKYFPPESKARAQAMVANIVSAFDRRIQNLAWMSPATKEQARAKLKVLYVGIGYPETWIDYTGLTIDPADALGNAQRASEFNYRRRVALIGGAVDPTEWCMLPQEVNAVNMPMQNALDFPAAILQPPFFDAAAPDAVNYGAIGSVIGHEISHSFDDQGCEFDSDGRLRNWWTPDDLAHFKASGAALVAQYDTYRPFPDLAVNGGLTLSENIADLAGLAAAYDGFRAVQGGQPTPTADVFTADQQFFIAFAQGWRGKARENTLRQQVLSDGHAPGQYRALTVRNLDAWYEAFGIKPTDALYLAPAERVRVW